MKRLVGLNDYFANLFGVVSEFSIWGVLLILVIVGFSVYLGHQWYRSGELFRKETSMYFAFVLVFVALFSWFLGSSAEDRYAKELQRQIDRCEWDEKDCTAQRRRLERLGREASGNDIFTPMNERY